MIGNSASLNGNHDEVFLQLSKLDLRGRKIIVPLSYGNMKLKDYLIEKGNNIFGSSFVPLTEFMPLDNYIDTMQHARTYIYGNYRQEGFGNIVMALCWGGVVFLHPNNALLSYFKDLGCILFSTKELPEKIHYVLSENEKSINKEIILKTYCKKRLLDIIVDNFGPDTY